MGIRYLARYLGLRETKLQENGESYIIMSYMYCILCLTLLGILSQKTEMGRTHNTFGGTIDKCIQNVGGKT